MLRGQNIKKKILIVSTVSRQFYLFEKINIQILFSLGYEIHCAANFGDASSRLDFLPIIRHHIDFDRSPVSSSNVKAFIQLRKLMKELSIEVVHCHSPVGGVVARLAAASLGIKKVLYTAHGFHFFKSAPYLNWLIFYPIEFLLSFLTDSLIVINEEDYSRAKQFYARKLYIIPGIGIDTSKFKETNYSSDNIRNTIGIENDSLIILSVGELIDRKNYKTALHTIKKLENENIVYLICGIGEREKDLKDLSKKLGISNKVKFLGYRNDIILICGLSDIFFFPSLQEGLPVALMEAMASGLPIVCSKIRGNVDLIQEGKGGFLCNPFNSDEFANGILELIKDESTRKRFKRFNINNIGNYDSSKVETIMTHIYKSYLD